MCINNLLITCVFKTFKLKLAKIFNNKPVDNLCFG